MVENQTCQRCGHRCATTIMSMFNTEVICLPCKDAERQDPRYHQAAEAEAAAIRHGNYNFPGIGRRP